MSTTTSKLKLIKPVPSDYWDVEKMNANMDTLDKLTHIVTVGTRSANVAQISGTQITNAVTWRYKKYNDGTFTAHTSWSCSWWECINQDGQDGTWRAGAVKLYFPSIGIATIENEQFHVRCSEYSNWGVGRTSADNISYTSFELVGLVNETKRVTKRVFVQIDGTWK